MEEAHRAAFSCVQELINRDIVFGEKIVQLSYLTKIYTESLSKIDFTNNNYRPENLRAKIENCNKYKNSISFAKPRELGSSLADNKLMCESFQLGTNKELKMSVKPLKPKLSHILKKLKEPNMANNLAEFRTCRSTA